jgi:adenylate cyclase
MENPVEVSELLPPEEEFPGLSDEAITVYEEGLDRFIQGDWQTALRCLHRVPAEDQVKDFLTVLIAQHDRIPPPGWDGIIQLESK